LEDIYPCPRSVGLLREAVELAGAKKLLWGSDLPVTFSLHTYRQLVEWVRLGAAFLSEAQIKQILHDNARTVFTGLTRA
jgi:predicted TIM-barrel fold metal-dependent hydrolase